MTNRARSGLLLGALFAFGAGTSACGGGGGAAAVAPAEVAVQGEAAPRESAPAQDPARPAIDDGRAPRKAAPPSAPQGTEPIAFKPWSLVREDEALKKRTPLLVYVRADWCTACVKIERDVFTHPEVRRAAAPFIPVEVDLTNDTKGGMALAERFEATMVPCMKVVHVEGSTTSPRLRQGACLPDVITPEALASALDEAAR